jgi:hypothetical protein
VTKQMTYFASIFLASLTLFSANAFAQSSSFMQSDTSVIAIKTTLPTGSCSRETSDQMCSDRTVGSRCQTRFGVGYCTMDTTVPNDPYGLPSCLCL